MYRRDSMPILNKNETGMEATPTIMYVGINHKLRTKEDFT